jgi:septum site-determining protein MinD
MRAITVISGKGGVGKTTTAINLAISLNKAGKKVTLIDANLTTPDIGIYLGAPYVPIAIQDVLKGKCHINDAVYAHHSGTKIVPSSISLKDNHLADLSKLKSIVEGLKRENDMLVIDAPAGLGQETLCAINAADECLIVTNAELPSITAAMKSINIAKSMNKKIAGIVLTRSSGKKELSADEIISLLEYPILAVIPEDISMKEAVLLREAIVETNPKSSAARGYEYLAERIISQNNAIAKSFLERLRDMLKI